MSVNYQVNKQELKDATKIFTKLGRRKSKYVSETVVEFLVGKIEITFDGMTVEVKARGKGKGRARIKSGFMKYLNSGIKGFPGDFEFLGSMTDQYKMIGNAVPPKFLEVLARSLLKL